MVKARKVTAAEKRDRDTWGLTPQDRAAIMAAQGGRCVLCRQATGASRRLAVEHDHRLADELGEVRPSIRGLACSRCNILIGLLDDDPVRAEELARYLRERPAQKILSGH